MPKEAIHSKHAPAALGPYSQGTRTGNTVYLSGQLGLDPATGNLVDGVEAQAHQVFRNLRAVAQAAGGELDDIAKLTLLMADLADFAQGERDHGDLFQGALSGARDLSGGRAAEGGALEVEGILVLAA